MLITVIDYQNEIARIQAAINKTNSPKQKRDYGKYIKKLKRELAAAQILARRGR